MARINPSTFKQYAGEYDMQGTAVKIYTKENDTSLYLFVSGYPEYQFIPTGKHKFSSKISEGSVIEFKTVENGVFKELIGTQPDGRYTATRK